MQDLSTFSGMITPPSTFYLEANNSGDFSDYYYYLNSIEKHPDSIISSEQAKKLQFKKSHIDSAPSSAIKIPVLDKLNLLREDFTMKIRKITESYSSQKLTTIQKHEDNQQKHFLIGSPFSPVDIPDSFNDPDPRLLQLRDKHKTQHDSELKNLAKHYEEKKNTIIEEKRVSLQNFWRNRMLELNRELQEAEWNKNSRKTEEEEKVKQFYETLYLEALAKEKVLLEEEIDQHFKQQFQEKSKNIKAKKGKNQSDEREVRARIAAELKSKAEAEKKSWRLDAGIKEQSEAIIEKERLVQEEKRIKQKMEIEVEEIVEEAGKEVEKDVQLTVESLKKSQKDKEAGSHSEWADDATREFKFSLQSEAENIYKASIKPQLIKEITKSIKNGIEAQVFNKEQEKVFKLVSDELSFTFDLFKKESENFYKKELTEIEEAFQTNFHDKVKHEAEKKIAQKEKELCIQYLQKLEKTRSNIKKDFEDHYILEIKKNKEILLKEKTNYAQLKAKNNIQITHYEEEIAKNLEKLDEESIKYEAKLKETHQKTRLNNEDIIFRTEETYLRSPAKSFFNSSAILRPDLVKEIPAPLFPPSLSAKDIRPRNESNKPVKYYLGPSPKNSLMGETTSKILAKPSINVKSLSYDNLKPKDKLKTTKIKQNMYHELLKQKYGFIPPRLK